MIRAVAEFVLVVLLVWLFGVCLPETANEPESCARFSVDQGARAGAPRHTTNADPPQLALRARMTPLPAAAQSCYRCVSPIGGWWRAESGRNASFGARKSFPTSPPLNQPLML